MRAWAEVYATPTPSSSSSDARSDLAFHVSGFMVRTEGVWSERALIRFCRFLQARGLTPSLTELREVLVKAKAGYQQSVSRLYICDAEPCRTAHRCDEASDPLLALAGECTVPVSRTGCQGHCKQAPLLTLRVGRASQMFGRVAGSGERHALAQFAKDAARAGSLLVPSGGTDEFRYDPHHRHEEPIARLKAMRFLLGHFRGEGRFASGGARFQKELVGTYEAGGRFIALRMEARYQLPEGGTDMHRALVIVGSERQSEGFTGRAYTDGGTVREYAIERRELALEFQDDTPDHGHHWQRARKILAPTNYGYEERLEVDAGEGFTPYYTVSMSNLSRSRSAALETGVCK